MHRKKIVGVFLLLSILVCYPKTVHAYIDPATTTYIIQIISALVITLGVSFGIFFNRIRMYFVNIRVKLVALKVKLFSEKKKNVREVRPAGRMQAAEAEPVGKWQYLWGEKRSFKTRLGIAALVGFAFPVSFIFFGIFNLYVSNRSNFPFEFQDIMWAVIGVTILVALMILLILMLLKGRIFDIAVTLLFGGMIAGLVQGFLLNASLGELTGDKIAWETFGGRAVTNSLIWCLILLVPFAIWYIYKKAWSIVIRYVSGLLLVVQLIAVFLIVFSQPELFESRKAYMSSEGIYTLGKENNVIVIILDRLDNKYIEAVLVDDPEFFEPMDGFVRFTNNLSSYSQTFPSVASLLTERYYYYDMSDRTYLKQAWQDSRFLPGLRDAGFVNKLYTEGGRVYRSPEDLVKAADNIAQGHTQIMVQPILSEFMKLSAFRNLPLAFKPFFWTHTGVFGQYFDEGDTTPYIIDDVLFYNRMMEQQLSVGENNKEFTFIHLNGPHNPYTMNERAELVDKQEGTILGQTKGSFFIVYEYLKQLKQLGLYEDATIIVTGDHGARRDNTNPLVQPIVTGMFVKPSGSVGTPLQMNNAPVGPDNFRATIYQAAGLDYSMFGETYFEVSPDANRTRILYQYLIPHDGVSARLLEYHITGDAKDFANWQLVNEENCRQAW